MRRKSVYTTGEAADICGLSQQTIIRCVDNGQIPGSFRVPGSRFRRIPRQALIKFMKTNGIPMEGIDSDKIRVLMVDDDRQIVELFTDVMKTDGRFETATASTGYDAGVLTQSFAPDIVVLDYLLPDVNGNVVCRTIRENPDLAHIKVLIISGVVNPADIEKLKKAGADDFIKKPFNIEHLIQRIIELVRG